MLKSLASWSPLALFLVIACYTMVVVGAVLAPMIAPVIREARRARRDGDEPNFQLLQPYPVYLLRYRRRMLLLVVPPVLLIGAWAWARA